MLIAASSWREGAAFVTTMALLGRVVRAAWIHRGGLRYDSRHHVGNTRPRGLATLYLVLEGHVSTAQGTVSGPHLWLLREDELEHRAPEAPSFQSWGDPFTVLNISAPSELVRAPLGLAVGPRPAPDGVWGALGAIGRSTDAHVIAPAFEAVWSELVGAGLVRAVPEERWSIDAEPHHLLRLWRSVDALYHAPTWSGSIDALADVAGISVRQLRRDMQELEERHGIGGTFRSASRILRVRRAVLLLSAPHVPLAQVARAAGYGSLSAMGRAFRDVGLPAPIEIRNELGV